MTNLEPSGGRINKIIEQERTGDKKKQNKKNKSKRSNEKWIRRTKNN